MSNSVWPHLQQPTRLCCHGDSPGKNTGVGCHQKMISIFVNIIQVDNRYICEYLVQCYIKCQFKGKYVVSHNERSVKKKKICPFSYNSAQNLCFPIYHLHLSVSAISPSSTEITVAISHTSCIPLLSLPSPLNYL